MMMRARFTGLILFAILTLIPLANAQDGQDIIEPASDAMVNPDANISFPPPVYVVSGSVEIRGTVALPNLREFFIQFRELVLDETEALPQEEADWLPATLPQTQSVTDGILGIWNTFMASDGLYELRIAINPNSDSPEYVRVSPIRVENDPPAFLQTAVEPEPEAEKAEAAEAEEETVVIEVTAPPEEPAPTPTPEDTSPRVVALTDSNVRAGDSTQYQRVGFLMTGQTAKIRGISSRNTGWYFIELGNGRSGFIYPDIVRAEGDVSNLERITPPPPPPPTPIPVIPTAAPAPPQPSSGANLAFVGGSVKIDPHPATCGKAYKITLTVVNNGSAAASSGGLVKVRDTHQASGANAGETHIAFGPLAVNATQEVFGHLTVSTHFNELHNITLYLDSNNQVTEANENDNIHATAPYILQKGSC